MFRNKFSNPVEISEFTFEGSQPGNETNADCDPQEEEGLLFEGSLQAMAPPPNKDSDDDDAGNERKQETDPQSSLVKTDIPVTTQDTIPSYDQEVLFETFTVSDESQLMFLPPKLDSLRIQGCNSLDVIQDDLLDGLPFLKDLELINCSNLRSIPYPSSVTTIYISECRNFELLKSREKLSFIQSLSIGSSCDSLTTFTLDLFPTLKMLSIWDCPNLVSFNVTGVYKGDFALECLAIKNCPGLTSFPDEEFHTPNLHSMSISNCKNLRKFPNFITSLRVLILIRCPHIECFPNGGLPSSLTLLTIAYCDKLTSQKEWGLENLKSLTRLTIEGGFIGMESFPKEKLLPGNVLSLHISKLKSLKKLDDKGFQQLNALRTLRIDRCDVLRYLPEQGLPPSLNELYIMECPMLTPRLEPETGKYWCKVDHIQHIEINGKRVREPCYRY